MLYNASHSAVPAEDKRLDQLEEAVTELKVIARVLKEGLNVADEPATVREDIQSEAE